MNLGQIFGYLLIISGIALSIALVVNGETSKNYELSTFFSAYAGVCVTMGVIVTLKTREKPSFSKVKLSEIRIFSERD